MEKGSTSSGPPRNSIGSFSSGKKIPPEPPLGDPDAGLAHPSGPDVEQQTALALGAALQLNPSPGKDPEYRSVLDVAPASGLKQRAPGNAGGVSAWGDSGGRLEECKDQDSVGPGGSEVSCTGSRAHSRG